MTAPSGWTINTVMGIASSVKARLEADGVVTDEAELLATLREEGADVDTILLRLFRARDEAGRQAGLVADRIKDLETRKARFTRRYQEYDGAAMAVMDAIGITQFHLPEYTPGIRIGPQKVGIIDETLIPDDLMRISKEPDKTAIAQKLRAGEDVPGAVMLPGTPSLVVLTK